MPSFSAESAAALGGPGWLASDRQAALERFTASELPTSAAEEWRYSRIEALDLDRFGPAIEPPGAAPITSAAAGSLDVPGLLDLTALLGAVGSGATVVETRDGFVTRVRGVGGEVTVDRLSAAGAGPEPLGELAGEPDALATLNRAFAPDPLLITVAPGSAASPVVIVHWCTGDDLALFPRILLRVGESAEAQVLEVVAGPAGCLVVPVTELDVAGAAHLSYLHVQALGPAAWQIGLQASRVAADGGLV
ncbi:MAG: hypothetical protein JO337_03455, partial [Acidimicrobiales bacterium]|nr:hypothetical protein [Acidimicrobiales bacterium]